jgi:hypothetical protein
LSLLSYAAVIGATDKNKYWGGRGKKKRLKCIMLNEPLNEWVGI